MAGYNGAWTGQQIDEAVRQVTNKDLPADGVKFTDGQTFQQKYDAGQLTGPSGKDGKDGDDGTPGLPGQDGFSPTASVTQTEDGAKITITDKSGTTNATITNGKDGINGTDGADGQTPNITPGNIETLPAGSDVTASITGQTPNLVLNLGIPQGEPGPQGPAGADGVPGYTPQRGVDYWTDADKQDIVAATVAALPVYAGEVE